MTARWIWRVFFILSYSVVAWFVIHFGLKAIPYVLLSSSTEAVIDEMTVEPLPKEEYGIVARYHYTVGGKKYEQKYVFTTPIFPNKLAAESHLGKHWHSTKPWRVFYSQKHPERATLQKLFPFKLLFNACLSLGIVFYFFWLRHYVRKSY